MNMDMCTCIVVEYVKDKGKDTSYFNKEGNGYYIWTGYYIEMIAYQMNYLHMASCCCCRCCCCCC